MTTTRIRPCGEAALLLECADLAEAVALAGILEGLRPDAVDVVAAARTVLVTARDSSTLPGLRRRVESLLAENSPPGPRIRYPNSDSESRGGVVDSGGAGTGGAVSGEARVVTIDVRYDGPDLADVAQLAGMSTEAFVRLHTSITWRAAFGGFAPGFFYLVDARELETRDRAAGEHPAAESFATENAAGGAIPGMDAERLPGIPRLGSPRPRVAAGSVGLADRFCAVYPGASPGGWRLLGTTDAPLWDLDRPEPALLAPGVVVRFRDLGGGRGARGTRGTRGTRGARSARGDAADPDGAG